MKKIFLAALTAMALCSYSYAQDDEDEYEEEDTPAASSAPANSSAPAASESSAAAAPVQSGAGTLALGLDLVDALDHEGIQKFYVSFKFAPNMELSAILGLYHHGETTRETEATQFTPATEVDRADDYTQIQIGVGFDYYFMQVVLPLSIGGEFLISHWGEDNNQFTLNAMAGVHANVVGGLYLTGKVGLGFDYIDREGVEGAANYEDTRLDVGFKASAILSWYFM